MGVVLSRKPAIIISEMRQDSTIVTIDDQYEIAYALSIGAEINDLG